MLWQFLLEAAFLTSLGGVIGIVLGAGIGWLINVLSGFPISLPWWSFAIGLGFSAGVGIFFGIFPAFKAARLDPIEALATSRSRCRCTKRQAGQKAGPGPRAAGFELEPGVWTLDPPLEGAPLLA